MQREKPKALPWESDDGGVVVCMKAGMCLMVATRESDLEHMDMRSEKVADRLRDVWRVDGNEKAGLAAGMCGPLCYCTAGGRQCGQEGTAFNVRNALMAMRVMTKQMMHFHANGIIIGDICPMSVCLDEHLIPKWMPFSSHRVGEMDGKCPRNLFWAAPEVWATAWLEIINCANGSKTPPDHRYATGVSTESDVYSLGLTFLMMVCGKRDVVGEQEYCGHMDKELLLRIIESGVNVVGEHHEKSFNPIKDRQLLIDGEINNISVEQGMLNGMPIPEAFKEQENALVQKIREIIQCAVKAEPAERSTLEQILDKIDKVFAYFGVSCDQRDTNKQEVTVNEMIEMGVRGTRFSMNVAATHCLDEHGETPNILPVIVDRLNGLWDERRAGHLASDEPDTYMFVKWLVTRVKDKTVVQQWKEDHGDIIEQLIRICRKIDKARH